MFFLLNSFQMLLFNYSYIEVTNNYYNTLANTLVESIAHFYKAKISRPKPLYYITYLKI